MIELRRIEALASTSLHGVRFKEDLGDPPEIRWVNPRDLLVDETYQRGLHQKSIKLIRNILRNFDWASFEAPTVVETAEGLKVTNGQHTATACATHPTIDLIPVLVSKDRAVSGQAKAFLDHNTNRVGVTLTQVHHSALVAGDEVSLQLQKIIEETGLRILKNPPPKGQFKPGDTVAVGTLHKLYHLRGPAKLRVILDLLKTRTPVLSMEMKAVDVLMHDVDYRPHWDVEAARSILVASSAYEVREAEAIAATHTKPQYLALAMVWFRRMPRRAPAPTLRRAS